MFNKLLTVGEKTEELGVTTETLRRWRNAGEGPAYVSYGGLIRYWREGHAPRTMSLGDVA